jgi:hypothetical protein
MHNPWVLVDGMCYITLIAIDRNFLQMYWFIGNFIQVIFKIDIEKNKTPTSVYVINQSTKI